MGERAEGARWASTGGQAPPLRPFYVAGGGHRGAEAAGGRAASAGGDAAHPGRERRAGEGGRRLRDAEDVAPPPARAGGAGPALGPRPWALGPPGPQPRSTLAARLRVWEKVLGAGAWGGGSGHCGHRGDPGFPRSTGRLHSGCGGAAQLTGDFRNGVEGPDGERPLKRVRILPGSAWALPPICLSLPRPQHLFSLQSVQIKKLQK